MSRVIRYLIAFAVLVVVAWPSPAGAHTGFEESDPADGAVVSEPVAVITLTFSGPAEPTGEGFVVFDPLRGERDPTRVVQVAEGTFELHLDPPLADGQVGVRWSVRAPDAHPINGEFSFTVDAPAPASPSDQAPSAQPESTSPAQPESTSPAQPGSTSPVRPETTSPAGKDSASSARPDSESSTSPDSADLDAFLDADRTSAVGRRSANVGRFVSMGATMVAVGFLVFSVTVMRGSRDELRMLLHGVRWAGVAVAVGTVVDALGRVARQGGGLDALLDPGAYSSALAGSAGVALGMRLVGGVVIASRADLVMIPASETGDAVATMSASVPIGAGSVSVAERGPGDWYDQDLSGELNRRGTVAMAGFVAVLASHIFDGHTVTEGNRLVTGAMASVHVLAAAVWVGGVLALALVVHRRWRRGQPTRALLMVTRYSVVATIALAVVAVAGVYLAVVILDSPQRLWSTEWGRYLLAKVALVAVAAGFGIHNHYRIVPALEAAEEDPATVRSLRANLVMELVALTGATVITALLVRAASTL